MPSLHSLLYNVLVACLRSCPFLSSYPSSPRLLVKLLIAHTSNTSKLVTDEGTILRWHFERVSLISEFEDTELPIPPPLNVVWLLKSVDSEKSVKNEVLVYTSQTRMLRDDMQCERQV